jgi:nitroreductase
MEFTEVIKRRKMVRAFTGEPLAPGTADRLLKAAERAPSAGFSQGYSFLVLEGAEQCAPLWKILSDAVGAERATADENPAEVTALNWFTAATGRPHRMASGSRNAATRGTRTEHFSS